MHGVFDGWAKAAHHDAVASLWARAKVENLMNQDLAAMQQSRFPEDLKQQITGLGVAFHLMTQFTSFVAVEEMTVTVGGKPTAVAVPVEMPEGVSHEGVFGLDSVSAPRGGVITGLACAGAAPPMSPSPTAGRVMKQQVAHKSKDAASSNRVAEVTDLPSRQAETPASQPAVAKLAPVLRDLAKKVGEQGRDGNLTTDGVKVANYQVDVMIYLADVSDKTLEALKQLGFVKTGESKTIRLLVGTIDVRKLEELARIDAVARVTPVTAN